MRGNLREAWILRYTGRPTKKTHGWWPSIRAKALSSDSSPVAVREYRVFVRFVED
jgi:hypothetical protein